MVKKEVWGVSLVVQWLKICLAMQRTQFGPWCGKIACAAEQLSLCATTSEPTSRAQALQQEKPPQ